MSDTPKVGRSFCSTRFLEFGSEELDLVGRLWDGAMTLDQLIASGKFWPDEIAQLRDSERRSMGTR